MWRGVAPSGLPMPKSMMSSPRRRAETFISPVMLKTYGGQALNPAELFHERQFTGEQDFKGVRGSGIEG